MDQAEKTVVLLVEDEPLTRMDACGALEAAGFEVLDAGDAETALGLLLARRDIAVLFTDVQMPGAMNGLELARAVHALRPDVKIIVTSGGLSLRNEDLPDAGVFVPKPYRAEGLAALVA